MAKNAQDVHQTITPDKSSAAPNGLLQRKCACGGTPGPSGECATCRAKRLGLQRAATSTAESKQRVPPIVHDVLRSPGWPLDPATRAFMEPRFGHDFSRVRIHTDARSASSAQAVNALAYTVGHNVVFGPGQYAPQANTGKRLLAHELTHVVQQAQSNPAAATDLTVTPPANAHETDADTVAQHVIAGSARTRPRPSPNTLQRQEEPAGSSGGSGSGGTRGPLIPRIPIPVFDEFDPMISVPDIEGIPSILRGQEVKLSTLRSALEVLRGRLPSSTPGRDFCDQLIAGYETANSGAVAGLCCPQFVRDRDRCCRPQEIAMLDYRCCRADEVVLNGHCFRPPPAPTPTPTQVPSLTLPPLQLGTQPIRFGTIESMTIDHFGVNSSTVPTGDSARLDHVARLINLYSEVEVHIEGHTDSTYTADYNQSLSERRANAVRDALVRRGVDPTRLQVSGFGDRQRLIQDDLTAEDKARNRRVDIWFHIPPREGLGSPLGQQRPSLLTPP